MHLRKDWALIYENKETDYGDVLVIVGVID